MKVSKILLVVFSVLYFLIGFPISLYLQWKIMKAINATDLMWFLFWVQWPLLCLTMLFSEVVKVVSKDE